MSYMYLKVGMTFTSSKWSSLIVFSAHHLKGMLPGHRKDWQIESSFFIQWVVMHGRS